VHLPKGHGEAMVANRAFLGDKEKDKRDDVSGGSDVDTSQADPMDLELVRQFVEGEMSIDQMTPGALKILHSEMGQEDIVEMQKMGSEGADKDTNKEPTDSTNDPQNGSTTAKTDENTSADQGDVTGSNEDGEVDTEEKKKKGVEDTAPGTKGKKGTDAEGDEGTNPPGGNDLESGPGGGDQQTNTDSPPGGENENEGPGAEGKKDGGADKVKGKKGGEKGDKDGDKDGKGGGPPAPAVDEKTPDGGGEPPPDAPAPMPEPVPEAGESIGGSLAEFKESHTDPTTSDSVTNIASLNGQAGRDAIGLKANTPKPPEKSWTDAIWGAKGAWFSMNKKMDGNKYQGKGGDPALAFMTNLNAGIDFASSMAGKIGLAATVAGAILTLLIPPVGAFLLTVGRIANAVSLVCAGLRMVTSIVKTVLLAVRAAKEKDPRKRLEMMQDMKSEVQAGVASGIELIMSKIGGKVKGGTKAAKGGVGGAMKAGWKEGGLKGAMKAGYKTVKSNIGAGLKSMKTGMSNKMSLMKELGVGGTLKAGMKAGWTGLKGGVKKIKIVKGVTDFKGAWKALKGTKQSFKDFGTLWTRNGGGFKGYWKTVGKMNFPNLGTATGGWKTKLGALKTDMLDTAGGGYATRVHIGMTGVPDDPKKGKFGDPSSRSNKTADRKHDLTQDEKNIAISVETQKAKVASLEKALAGGNKNQKVKALGHEEGQLSDDLKAEGSNFDESGQTSATRDTRKRSAAYKYRGGNEYSAAELDQQLRDKLHDTRVSQNLLGVKAPGSMAMDMGVAAHKTSQDPNANAGDYLGNVGKTALGHVGTVGSKSSKFMVNSKDKRALSGLSYIKGIAAENNKRTKSAMGIFANEVREEAEQGATAGKVNIALAPAIPIINTRVTDIGQAMAAKGGDAPATEGAQPPAPAPAPPAPAQDAKVPDIALLGKIQTERNTIKSLKISVQADIDKNESMKKEALKGLSVAKQYKLGFKTQDKVIADQEADATKDIAEIKAGKEQIAQGGKDIGGKKGLAEGEGKKADDKAKEGANTSAKPDEAKKRAEEEKEARAERREWEREYNSAGYVKRKYMKAKKWLFSFTKLLAKAAKWIWKKMIAPAIAAVKKALAKVMNFLSNMVMSGVMKIVKLFLSKEEGARLDESFAEMKKLEAEQAKQAVLDTKKENEKNKVKLTDAEQKAKAEVDRTNLNVTTGKGIIGGLDQNDAALTQEKAKVEGANAAFDAQYKPYFDYVKEQEAKGDQNASETEGAGSEGPVDAASQEKGPTEKPMDPAVAGAIGRAAGIITQDSTKSESDVKAKSLTYKTKLHAKGDALYDENMIGMKSAGTEFLDANAKIGQPGGVDFLPEEAMEQIQPKLAPIMADYEATEVGKVNKVKSSANDIHANICGAHTHAESQRRSRLAGIKAEVSTLTGKSGEDAANLADRLVKQLSREAKGLDEDKQQAYDDLKDAYIKLAQGV
jgi:hypothetical protein